MKCALFKRKYSCTSHDTTIFTFNNFNINKITLNPLTVTNCIENIHTYIHLHINHNTIYFSFTIIIFRLNACSCMIGIRYHDYINLSMGALYFSYSSRCMYFLCTVVSLLQMPDHTSNKSQDR